MVAAARLEADDFASMAMRKAWVAFKNDEWECYHQSITDWEADVFLRLY